MIIGKIKFENPIFLSPMAGVGDFAFRSICRECGADLTFTEMVSAKGLLYDSEKTKNMLKIVEEQPLAVQLFGKEPEVFSQVIKNDYLQNYDIVDINFGCPAPKIFKNGEGSALLTNYSLMQKIITSCKNSTNKPIGAKIRLGIDKIDFDIVRALEDSGVDYITVHGRTKEQGYSGRVNYDAISKIASFCKVPVIGNGDIVSVETLNKMRQTGVEGVSLARGALGNQSIFSLLKGCQSPLSTSDCIKQHVAMLKQVFPNSFLSKYLRKHFLWYCKGIHAPELKQEIIKMNDVDQVLKQIVNVIS